MAYNKLYIKQFFDDLMQDSNAGKLYLKAIGEMPITSFPWNLNPVK